MIRVSLFCHVHGDHRSRTPASKSTLNRHQHTWTLKKTNGTDKYNPRRHFDNYHHINIQLFKPESHWHWQKPKKETKKRSTLNLSITQIKRSSRCCRPFSLVYITEKNAIVVHTLTRTIRLSRFGFLFLSIMYLFLGPFKFLSIFFFDLLLKDWWCTSKESQSI